MSRQAAARGAISFLLLVICLLVIATPWDWGSGFGISWGASIFTVWSVVLVFHVVLLICLWRKANACQLAGSVISLQIVGAMVSVVLWSFRGRYHDDNLGSPTGRTAHHPSQALVVAWIVFCALAVLKVDGILLERLRVLGDTLSWPRTVATASRLRICEFAVALFCVIFALPGLVTPHASKLDELDFKLRMVVGVILTSIRVVLYGAGVPLFFAPVSAMRAAASSTWFQECRQDNAALLFVAEQQFVAVCANATIVWGMLLWLVLVASHAFRVEATAIYSLFAAFDCTSNAILFAVLSGLLRGRSEEAQKAREADERRRQRQRTSSLSCWRSMDEKWQEVVEDLACRGFSLKQLLAFYKRLPQIMLHFNPNVHTTTDVVRHAIIPESAKERCAYSRIMSDSQTIRPKKMVTHSWSNLFRDLVAAIVADALQQSTFMLVAHLLDNDIKTLEQMLDPKALAQTYWVCAFCVNQHQSICHTNPAGTVDPVNGRLHPVCQCGSEKYWNDTPPLCCDGKSIPCQMNKFSDMMAFLSAKDEEFCQVIAVDRGFGLFTRAWCVAELAEADKVGMRQFLKLASKNMLDEHKDHLKDLNVSEMRAARMEDVHEILQGIPDVPAFNAHLQEMLFGDAGLFDRWENLNFAEQAQEVGRFALLANSSMSLEIADPGLTSASAQDVSSEVDLEIGPGIAP